MEDADQMAVVDGLLERLFAVVDIVVGHCCLTSFVLAHTGRCTW